jgi:hypothetical protein
MGQVKGKGKQSEPTPETTAAGNGGGGKKPPQNTAAAGAPGGGDDDGDDDDAAGKGRRDERPAKPTGPPQGKKSNPEPVDTDDDEADLRKFSQIMSRALGETARRPADPPAEFTHAKHQDVRVWLFACKDFFGRNAHQ